MNDKELLEKTETFKEAAVREVLEETGYLCRPERPLGDTRYFYIKEGILIIKKVSWFLMSPISRESEAEPSVEAVLWKDYDSAEKLLFYYSDRFLVKKIRNY